MSKIFKGLRFDPSVRVIVLASESEKIWTAGLDGKWRGYSLGFGLI